MFIFLWHVHSLKYSIIDDQGFPQNPYVRKLHIVPRFGGIEEIFRL